MSSKLRHSCLKPITDRRPHRLPGLARDEQAFIERALASRAFLTWRAGETEKLIDYDARMFFQFSTGTRVSDRRQRVDFAMSAIRKAELAGIGEAPELLGLANFLMSTFGKLLEEN